MKVTVQRTSKGLKAWLLLSYVVEAMGILFFVAAFVGHHKTDNEITRVVIVALWTFGVGVVMHVLGRILVWWNHD